VLKLKMTEWYELLKAQRGELKDLMKAEGVKARYARFEFPLGSAESNKEMHLTGDYIGIVSITGTGTVKIRLDHRHSQEINLREVAEISAPFGKMYFTTDGAGGTCTVYIGGALAARLKPIQAKVSIRSVAGTDVDLALESTLGDVKTEITAQGVEQDKLVVALEWSGTPYSTPITSTNAVQRFEAATKKLRDVIIRNTDAANPVDIGVYHATPATFRGASFELAAASSVGFREIDMNKLGIISSADGNHAIVHVLGVTE
jgi:hypothetical protein